MTASELIAILTELVEAHGDLQCTDANDNQVSVEFNDDTGTSVFVFDLG
jgi:hypothetical protein